MKFVRWYSVNDGYEWRRGKGQEVRWESEKGDGAVIGCSYLKA